MAEGIRPAECRPVGGRPGEDGTAAGPAAGGGARAEARRRGRATAFRALGDAALVAVAGLLTVVGCLGAQRRLVPPLEPLDPLGWALALTVCAALGLLRTRPLTAFVVMAGALTGYLAGRYPYGPPFFAVIPAMYVLTLAVPVRRAAGWCLAAFAVLVGTILAVEWPAGPADTVAYTASWALALVMPLSAGVIVRRGREYTARTRAREAELARIRLDEEVARRAYEERLRLAREVHDVVAHGLSVISMQSGGALHVFDRDPERARAALRAIRTASGDALRELRSTLAGVRSRPVRGPGDVADGDGRGACGGGPGAGLDAGGAPDGVCGGTAGLSRLDELAARMAHSGLAVAVRRRGAPGPVPAAVGAAVYRIVQESLTNVLRHAGSRTATVTLDHGPGEITVQITDPGAGGGQDEDEPRPNGPARSPAMNAPAANGPATESGPAAPGSGPPGTGGTGGHGIAGMCERAAALGGTLTAGPRPGGGFGVRARLPIEPPARPGRPPSAEAAT